MVTYPFLTILVFLPLAGSLAVFLFGSRPVLCRATALAVVLGELCLAAGLALLVPLEPAASGTLPGYFLVEDQPWIATFGIRYLLAMDGISLLMVLLTSLLATFAVLFSWKTITERVAAYYGLLLLATSGILGVFLALDLFLFYLFWEVMLIPLFFLICVWGQGQRVKSALRFFLFTIGGSLLMLLAIIGLYQAHGAATGMYTFALPELLGTPLAPLHSCLLFAAFLLAFAVKTPIFPLHGWLPDAYSDAPTAATLLLAGLMAKTGVYGLLRFAYPLFPDAAVLLTPLISVLAVVGIIYASWLAYAQTDIKRLLAYSSFGHMGFIVLGIAAWTPLSLSGSVIQMVNHGITTGALFLMAGMLEERSGLRDSASFGALWGKMPYFGAFFLLFSLATLGLPGLNNFVGEFLILAGVFRVSPLAAVVALGGIILVLIYTLRLVQQLLFGPEKVRHEMADLSFRELAILASLALLVIGIGVYPVPVLDLIRLPIALVSGGTGGVP
ncbi:MAG: NADH-quinone oxidoreductase subunit M [Deltaproteobacteria bacterium]|nr:NADH-quinone oxidoreductase subunit M [Deltaproteobacteria bacterium]TLN04454.1 MAG: NADH-quinone oxidoreductase subunit M [bacterium]